MPQAELPASAMQWRRKALHSEAGDLVAAPKVIAACANYCGFSPCPLPKSDPLLSGASALLDHEAGCIWYDSSLPKHRRFRILAHEFAHIALHDYAGGNIDSYAQPPIGESSLIGYSQAERRERHADEWAGELLLPLSAIEIAFFVERRSVASIAVAVELPEAFVLSRLRELLASPNNQGTSSQVLEPVSILATLDHSQQAAARTGSRIALISAGPGTGKTRTLAARAEWLMNARKVAPESIAVLTFSRRAAGELAQRLSRLTADSGTPWIGTIHAYAYELLRRFTPEAGLRENWRVVSAGRAEQLMDGAMYARSQNGSTLSSQPVSSMLRAISQFKERLVDGLDFVQFIDAQMSPALENMHPVDAAFLRDCRSFYELYQSTLAAANQLDFGDLLNFASNLLETNSVALQETRQRCRHLLVDEFQDLTPAAFKFVELLAGSSGSDGRFSSGCCLWAVGDRLQTIYRFQSGSDWSGMDRLSERNLEVCRYTLDVNYRSSERIVDMLNGVAAKLTKAQSASPSSWRAATATENDDKDRPAIAIAAADDDISEFDGIAVEIGRRQKLGVPLREQAVLCRTNSECMTAANELKRRSIPVLEADSWLDAPPVKQLMQALESAAGENDTECRSRPIRLHRSPGGLLHRIVFDESSMLHELWARRSCDAAAASYLQSIHALLQEVNRWEQEDELLYAASKPHSPERLIAFASHMRGIFREPLQGRSIDRSSDAATPGVPVMTVHAAKGLEFDTVYLPNLIDGAFPKRGGDRREARLVALLKPCSYCQPTVVDEESCLFFVAISRARRHVVLSYTERSAHSQTSKHAPSPFLRLLRSTPAGGRIETLRWRATLPKPAKTDTAPISAQSIAEAEKLNLQDMLDYEACPRRFRYMRQPNTASAVPSRIQSNPPSLLEREIVNRQRKAIAKISEQQIDGAPDGAPESKKQAGGCSSTIRRCLNALGFNRKPVTNTILPTAALSPEQARRIRVARAISDGLYPAQPDSSTRCIDCSFRYICPDDPGAIHQSSGV